MLQDSSVLTRNAVNQSGRGEPILLMHGFGCDQSMWNELRPLLRGRIIQYDLTGMGDSDHAAYDEQLHSSLQGHADDLIEIMDALNEEPMLVVAHSVSSVIAGLAAIKRPELFRGIVMLGPNPHYLNDPPYMGGFEKDQISGLVEMMASDYLGWAKNLAGMVGGEDRRAGEILEDRFCRNDPAITRHFARVTFGADNRADLPKITVPTLVIQCSDDAIAPPSVGKFVVDAIPDSSMYVIESTGHAPHMSNPRETAMAIEEFAGRLRLR